MTRCRYCKAEIRWGLVASDNPSGITWDEWSHAWSGSIYCGAAQTTKAAP